MCGLLQRLQMQLVRHVAGRNSDRRVTEERPRSGDKKYRLISGLRPRGRTLAFLSHQAGGQRRAFLLEVDRGASGGRSGESRGGRRSELGFGDSWNCLGGALLLHRYCTVPIRPHRTKTNSAHAALSEVPRIPEARTDLPCGPSPLPNCGQNLGELGRTFSRC